MQYVSSVTYVIKIYEKVLFCLNKYGLYSGEKLNTKNVKNV